MAKIPLNYFTRKSIHVQDYPVGYPTLIAGLSSVYETPFDRASVIISALATNTSTTNTQTIYAALSTRGTAITEGSPEAIQFISNFPIAPNDTVNIVVNKLVLSQYDNLFVWSGVDNTDTINLTLSILETVNTK
jgi:hypothetical protein